MKKIIALVMTLTMILSATAAFADVLSDGWRNADDDTVRAAILALSAELASRSALRTEGAEPIVITGQGLAIQYADVPFSPAKATIESDKGIRVTLTNESDEYLDGADSGFAQEVLHRTGTYTCLIEGDGDWTLTFEPVSMIEAIPARLTGDKSYISDGFMLSSPAIIHVEATADTHDRYGYFTVRLFYHDKYGWNYSSGAEVHEYLTGSESVNTDIILKTETYNEPDMYVLYVFDDVGVEWSIELK